MIQKKIGRYMGIAMGITMSVVMSTVGSFTGALRASQQSPDAPFLAVWLPSLGLSVIIATIIALLLGVIIPMKKINDGIENGTKTKGFVLHLIQGLVSDIIYTTIIGFTMAIVTTAVFALPNQQKGMDAKINGLTAEIEATSAQIAAINAKGQDMTEADKGQLAGLNEKMGQLNGELEGTKAAREHATLMPVAIKNFLSSFPFEFIIALIAIMILEPMYLKKAMKKYIPNFGEDITSDEQI